MEESCGDLETAVVAPPLLFLAAVECLVVDHVGVVVLEDRGQPDGARGLAQRHRVTTPPHEPHLVRRVEDALDVEVAHGGVEGEDVEVALAVEDEVSPHGVVDGAVLEDVERDLRGADGLVGAVLDQEDVWLPDLGVVGEGS